MIEVGVIGGLVTSDGTVGETCAVSSGVTIGGAKSGVAVSLGCPHDASTMLAALAARHAHTRANLFERMVHSLLYQLPDFIDLRMAIERQFAEDQLAIDFQLKSAIIAGNKHPLRDVRLEFG